MSDQFVGEIRMFGGTYAPQGWLSCDGSLVAISQYESLFTLISTTYGGDGVSSFAVPDLRSRVPVHQGSLQGVTYLPGQMEGTEEVTLSASQLATHAHLFNSSRDVASARSPSNAVPAVSPSSARPAYDTVQPYRAINSGSIETTGGSLPHLNIQPYLCLNFIIAYEGIFPSRGAVGEQHGATDDE